MIVKHPLEPTSVTLAEMLLAKEERVLRQNEMLKKSGTIISFTLNIPGPIKRFDLSVRSFETGRREIEAALRRNHIRIIDFLPIDGHTGTEGIWSVDAGGPEVKGLMVLIDDCHPLGRLFDIDVLTAPGGKIERACMGKPERKCLICHRPVSQCARSRRHTAEELYQAAVKVMQDYYLDEFSNILAQAAVKSLLYEACTGPKPGLVDPFHNGAHKDMDIFTFIEGSTVLYPYFKEITKKAYSLKHIKPENLLQHLQYLGFMAEESMYAATNGVNTHKGAIYALGILCAAYGYSYNFKEQHDLHEILDLCAKIASDPGESHLGKLNVHGHHTNGEAIYLQHHLKGARGEAASGFSSVKNYSLPALRQKLACGWTLNNAALFALFILVAHVDDTNIIARSGIHVLKQVQSKVKKMMNTPAISEDDILYFAGELEPWFTGLNLSPGGSADLLSVTLMLYFLGH